MHTIIHLGVPGDPASFMQESGRAGRDGVPSLSVLFTSPGGFQDSKVESVMKEYISNNHECRRKKILNYFVLDVKECRSDPAAHIWSASCTCGGNVYNFVHSFLAEIKLNALDFGSHLDMSRLETRLELNEKLTILRLSNMCMEKCKLPIS